MCNCGKSKKTRTVIRSIPPYNFAEDVNFARVVYTGEDSIQLKSSVYTEPKFFALYGRKDYGLISKNQIFYVLPGDMNDFMQLV